MQTPAYLIHLSRDKKLLPIIQKVGEIRLAKQQNMHLHLCSSIISQQLSVKAAATIYKRFLGLFDSTEPAAHHVLALTDEELRTVGLSNAKTQYVKNVCRFFLDHGITDAQLHNMEREEIIALLTQIKGVGRWTVEMILMFTLGREDVFAVDDLGIQQAMISLYKLDATDKKKLRVAMQKRAAKWAPYQTYACMYLWRYKDNV